MPFVTCSDFVHNTFNIKLSFFWDDSGIFAERLPLRYYLSVGMLLSGLFTCLFGLGFYLNIHSLSYYAFVQVKMQPHTVQLTVVDLQINLYVNTEITFLVCLFT